MPTSGRIKGSRLCQQVGASKGAAYANKWAHQRESPMPTSGRIKGSRLCQQVGASKGPAYANKWAHQREPPMPTSWRIKGTRLCQQVGASVGRLGLYWVSHVVACDDLGRIYVVLSAKKIIRILLEAELGRPLGRNNNAKFKNWQSSESHSARYVRTASDLVMF